MTHDAPRARYSRALEQAPELLATLNDQSAAELELRGEVQLARMLLEQLVSQLGDVHGRTGMLNPIVFQGVSGMLKQVQEIVRDASAIEAKRDDQRISATHILTLLVSLRDDLKRRLNMAFGEVAAQVVDDCFTRARWTGGIKEEDVRDALLEPAAFELKIRTVDREGDVLKEAAHARSLSSPELAALGNDDAKAEAADPLATDAPVEAA
jgi:hypothetical protein